MPLLAIVDGGGVSAIGDGIRSGAMTSSGRFKSGFRHLEPVL
jgi:hypothetical protein